MSLIQSAERLSLALGSEYGLYVAFSGGKDSQVLLDLVKCSLVEYKAFYNVTTNDPPKNVYFIRQYYPEVKFVHPEKNFFQLVSERGMPLIKRRYCCDVLKETHSAGNVVLTGVRANESKKRSRYHEVEVRSRRKENMINFKERTIDDIMEQEHRCIKGKDSVMVYPLLNWTEQDVWDYIQHQQLPINPCYEVSHRVGCMFCPFTKRAELEYYETKYPKFKERVIDAIRQYHQKRDVSGTYKYQSAEEYYEQWKKK